MCNELSLGLLCSALSRYLFKSFINHSVHTVMSDIDEFILSKLSKGHLSDKIIDLVNQIIFKQKSNPRYDYMTNEQVEIDRLVYQMYNLCDDDITEVEDWFFRRYPKLARVIEEKMKGKSDDR